MKFIHPPKGGQAEGHRGKVLLACIAVFFRL